MIYPYEIGQIDDLTCIVWSVSYISPTEHLHEIAQILAMRGYQGLVIFDLLLANGQAPNRFLSARFDGQAFDRTTFVVIAEGLEVIKRASLDFYHSHPELLENSVLPTAARFLIRKNVCI